MKNLEGTLASKKSPIGFGNAELFLMLELEIVIIPPEFTERIPLFIEKLSSRTQVFQDKEALSLTENSEEVMAELWVKTEFEINILDPELIMIRPEISLILSQFSKLEFEIAKIVFPEDVIKDLDLI